MAILLDKIRLGIGSRCAVGTVAGWRLPVRMFGRDNSFHAELFMRKR